MYNHQYFFIINEILFLFYFTKHGKILITAANTRLKLMFYKIFKHKL